MDMPRIAFEELRETIRVAFERAGMRPDRAAACARIHAESSLDGVNSHGLNRVERFIDYIHRGWVDVAAEAVPVQSLGSLEIWDGNLGPGVLNAVRAMGRATELAGRDGMAVLALRNTTHWMRGGTYGWQAADAGCMAICWTNTESCMPAWGARSECIGNNPFIVAVPRREGHLVLDMAMSQYSYGRLQVTRLKGERLPYAGGFDAEGRLTDDPAAIEATRRILPTGFWKGSGMAVMLDLVAAILSGGRTTTAVDRLGKGSCGSCCQVFMAFDPARHHSAEYIREAVEDTVRQLHAAVPAREGDAVRYPGERTLLTRAEHLAKGIPVDKGVWETVRRLAGLPTA